MAYYVVVLILAGIWRFSPKTLPRVADILFFSALLSVLYSAFLGIGGKIVIGKWCPKCMGLYAVNIGLFVTAWIALPDGPKAAFKRMFSVFTTKAFLVSAGLLALATFGAQGLYVAQAKSAIANYKAMQAKLGKAPPEHRDVKVGDAPGKGPENAPVVIVEYSDFECPYCSRLARGLAEAAKQKPEAFRYHFKHYPMDNACNPNIKKKFHEDACRAAKAAVCAQQQGRFWELHDLMFQNRSRLSGEDLIKYAAQVGIDVERMAACVDDPKTLERVQADIAEAKAHGVGGTPTFFVNGWKQVGTRKADEILHLVETARRDAARKAGKAP
jgi:protein-disulfide isomerase